MFTQMDPPLAPATVLPILTAQAPLLCAPYLESAIHAGTATAEVSMQNHALSARVCCQIQGFWFAASRVSSCCVRVVPCHAYEADIAVRC